MVFVFEGLNSHFLFIAASLYDSKIKYNLKTQLAFLSNFDTGYHNYFWITSVVPKQL